MVIFLDEINEQPAALRDTLAFYLDPTRGGALFDACRQYLDEHSISHVIYTGMGSSTFNSHIGYYYLNSRGFSCDVRDTGEFVDYFVSNFADEHNELVIGVSQSGESGELVRLIQSWQSSADPLEFLWAITNTPESTLAQNAKIVLPTIAGKETSVTSKTYTTGLLLHYLLARVIAEKEVCPPEIEQEINNMIDAIESALDPNGLFQTLAHEIIDFLGDFSFIDFIGHGPSMATVLQTTLNIKELAKICSEGITVGQFRHGPIETINENFRCMCFIDDSQAASIMDPTIRNILGKWGHGKVVVICNQPGFLENVTDENLKIIQVPIQNPYLAPIYDIILIQPWLCDLTNKRGFVPGDFRNTQKVTK